MYDDLARIERNYGCVAEYMRCQMEERNEEEEAYAIASENCARNKAKLESAGDRAMYFCEDCIGCKYYEMVGPTSPGFYYEDIDDIEHGICRHKEIPPTDGVGCTRREEIEE